jgi:hypothetical protein
MTGAAAEATDTSPTSTATTTEIPPITRRNIKPIPSSKKPTDGALTRFDRTEHDTSPVRAPKPSSQASVWRHIREQMRRAQAKP